VSFSETHFHPLTHSRPSLLHTHTAAPFATPPPSRGLNLTLYASQECQVGSLHLHIDWWGTLGRASARYWTAVPGWGVGVVTWLIFIAVGTSERGGRTAIIFRSAKLTNIRSSDAERVGIGVPIHRGGLSPFLSDHVCRIAPSSPPGLRSRKRRRDCCRAADAAYSFTRNWLGYR